jgi:hypothetical protein
LSPLKEPLQIIHHLIDILSNLIEVGIKDSLPFVPRLKIVEFGQVPILFFLLMDLFHIKVRLAEIYTGFSDGNNKKEKAK